MRPVLSIGQTCLRQVFPRHYASGTIRAQCRGLQGASTRAQRRTWNNFFESHPQLGTRSSGGGGGGGSSGSGRTRTLLASAIGLSPAAFVQLSEKENDGTELTAEGRMLAASRQEIKKEVGDDVRGWRRVRDSIVLFVDLYVWEPLCTGLRFLHLVVIFVPVIACVPAIWVGRRVKEKNNERKGTLWWYWFLVKSMERAGPAFIKVSILVMDG